MARLIGASATRSLDRKEIREVRSTVRKMSKLPSPMDGQICLALLPILMEYQGTVKILNLKRFDLGTKVELIIFINGLVVNRENEF